MGAVANMLTVCINRNELDELRRDVDRLKREAEINPWCCYKRGAYYKCSDTCWI